MNKKFLSNRTLAILILIILAIILSISIGPFSHVGRTLLYKITGYAYYEDISHTMYMTDEEFKSIATPEQYKKNQEMRNNLQR